MSLNEYGCSPELIGNSLDNRIKFDINDIIFMEE